ncbi:cupin domain-containing protein [Actinomadura sp. NPDC049753]|uniref:cupin domain-containing protein n=1 Tax=Actinomadura sp. NPDC049753 TaxID=3154739 RepID=UPI0034457C03
MTVTPIDLSSCFLHLDGGGEISAAPRAWGPERDGWRVAVFHAKTDADVHADRWEVHPEAEEVVCCLIGKIRLCLRPEEPGRREEEIRLTAGTAAIVPRGRWHRVELDTPSSIMAVTLPRGSRLEERTVSRPRVPVPGRAGPGR